MGSERLPWSEASRREGRESGPYSWSMLRSSATYTQGRSMLGKMMVNQVTKAEPESMSRTVNWMWVRDRRLEEAGSNHRQEWAGQKRRGKFL